MHWTSGAVVGSYPVMHLYFIIDPIVFVTGSIGDPFLMGCLISHPKKVNEHDYVDEGDMLYISPHFCFRYLIITISIHKHMVKSIL